MFVVLQLQQQELEQLHQLLRNGFGFIVKEQKDVLRGVHLGLKVIPS
jgi:hypothetical protein